MNVWEMTIPGYRPQNNTSEDWNGETILLGPGWSQNPDGSFNGIHSTYSNYETPEIYLNGDSGRLYAGVPGTPEYDEMQRAHKKSTKRGIATVASLVAGGALGGALAGGAAGAGGGGGLSLSQAGGMGARGLALQGLKNAGRNAVMDSFLPGESGGIPDVMGGGGGGVLTGMMPNSVRDWIDLGGKGLGLIQAMNPPDAPTPPSGTTEGTDSLPPIPPLNRSRTAMPSDLTRYGKSGGEHVFFGPADSASVHPSGGSQPPPGPETGSLPVPTRYAPRDPRRGVRTMNQGGLSQASPQFVSGHGSGRDDTVEALLSDGEYVIDAESVAMLGDGSLDEGAARLDQMRANLRKHKGAAMAKGEFSPNAKAPEQYIKRAKGGRMRYPLHPSTSAKDVPAEIQLERLEKFIREYKAASERANPPQPRDTGYDPYNRAPKRAKGGKVQQSLVARLRRALSPPDYLQTREFLEAQRRRSQVPVDEVRGELQRLDPSNSALAIGQAQRARAAVDTRRARTPEEAATEAAVLDILEEAKRNPIKRAKGGKVKKSKGGAVRDLNAFADRLEASMKDLTGFLKTNGALSMPDVTEEIV